MNYFIKRDLNEYGPYSLADLQKYVASGNILLTDLCRSEGLTDWVPVSQVIGNIPVPSVPQPVTPGVYPAMGAYAATTISPYPPPPSLHWGILILLSIVTCGIFRWIWALIQAAWVKKVQPESKGLLYFGIAVGLYALMYISAFAQGLQGERGGNAGLIYLVAWVGGTIMWLIAAFNMRDSIEEHFNTSEPIGLSLSGVMTFFFNVYYFQYHFTQINEMKRRQMTGSV